MAQSSWVSGLVDWRRSSRTLKTQSVFELRARTWSLERIFRAIIAEWLCITTRRMSQKSDGMEAKLKLTDPPCASSPARLHHWHCSGIVRVTISRWWRRMDLRMYPPWEEGVVNTTIMYLSLQWLRTANQTYHAIQKAPLDALVTHSYQQMSLSLHTSLNAPPNPFHNR